MKRGKNKLILWIFIALLLMFVLLIPSVFKWKRTEITVKMTDDERTSFDRYKLDLAYFQTLLEGNNVYDWIKENNQSYITDIKTIKNLFPQLDSTIINQIFCRRGEEEERIVFEFRYNNLSVQLQYQGLLWLQTDVYDMANDVWYTIREETAVKTSYKIVGVERK